MASELEGNAGAHNPGAIELTESSAALQGEALRESEPDSHSKKVLDFELSFSRLSQLPKETFLGNSQVLYDVARDTLTQRAVITGEATNNDSIYRELNRIMTNSGFPSANLEGKTQITDRNLPRKWNSITHLSPLILYKEGEIERYAASSRASGDDAETAGGDRGDSADQGEILTAALEALEKFQRQTRLKPGEVLWDIGTRVLQERAPLTGEATDANSIFAEINRIMKNSGFVAAQLEGKVKITEADLPDSWNSITNKDILTVYTDEDIDSFKDRIRERLGSGPAANPEPGEGDACEAGDENSACNTPPASGPEAADTDQSDAPAHPDRPDSPPVEPPADADDGDDDSSRGPDLVSIAEKLRRQHKNNSARFHEEFAAQGFLGSSFNFAKNKIGASSEQNDGLKPASLWSYLFDSDCGSESVAEFLAHENEKLTYLEAAAQDGKLEEFSQLYKELTGEGFDPVSSAVSLLTSTPHVSNFRDSQKNGVEVLSDITAGVVAAASLRMGRGQALFRALSSSTGAGFVLGGTSKAGIKQLDGRYADLSSDLLTGGILGATVPIGELAGAAMSRKVGSRLGLNVTRGLFAGRIETRGMGMGVRLLSAGTKMGTAGSVFGLIENPARQVIHHLEEGREITADIVVGEAVKGAAFGFVFGTALGVTFDGLADGFRRRRPRPVKDPEYKPPGGKSKGVDPADIPESGNVNLHEAAEFLGKKPDEFLRKAADDPYGAVADAARLYDETGLNIRKYDSATGKATVPEQFADALGAVQTVDMLTEASAAGIGKKIDVVKSADALMKESVAEVDDSIRRITSDSNYREVVRVTEEQKGASAAREFERSFQDSFKKDVHIGVAVRQINNPELKQAAAFDQVMSETESLYLAKAADFFKDITDPVKRARLNTLVDEIFAKFTPAPMTRGQLQEIVHSFPADEQAIAMALLERSAANSSDVGLLGRMRAIHSELAAVTGSGTPAHAYTLAPDTAGNMLGYLFRKSNRTQMALRNLDHLAQQTNKGSAPDSIVIFDDLSSAVLSKEQLELLARIPKVYAVDIGAFSKGINVLDMAAGPEAVRAKLADLVGEAVKVRNANSTLIPAGVAKAVLDDAVDQSAKSIGSNVVIVRPTGAYHHPTMPAAQVLADMDPLDSIYHQLVVPKASKEEIASFLSKYAGQERELAAQMLADGAVHNSFLSIASKIKAVHEQVAGILETSRLSVRDLLIVSDKDPGGSTHLISYIYGRVNGLSPENFISALELNRLIKSGLATRKAVAYLDDTIYSGSQTSSMLDNNIDAFMPFGRVIVGGLGAYEKGLTRLNGTHLSKIGKAAVAAADRHQPFYSAQHPFFGSLSPEAQSAVKRIGGSEGFGDVQGSLIWAYMYPDNNLTYFGQNFSGGVLKLPGP